MDFGEAFREIVGVNDWRRWRRHRQLGHHEGEHEPRHEVVGSALPAARRQRFGVVAFFGYLLGFVSPILGAVLLAVMLVRGETRHAGGVLLVCILSFMVRVVWLTHGAGY